jgi:copper resistance protein D
MRPLLVASSMSGCTEFGQSLALVPTILSGTHQGCLWYANSLALTALITAQFLKKPRASPLAAWLVIGALCVLAATRAASSHASEEGDFSLAEVSQFLHLLATSIWAGAILVSAFLVVPYWPAIGASTLWIYARRLSQTVTWALTVLVSPASIQLGAAFTALSARFGLTLGEESC